MLNPYVFGKTRSRKYVFCIWLGKIGDDAVVRYTIGGWYVGSLGHGFHIVELLSRPRANKGQEEDTDKSH